jgi:hypothetical protein
MSRTKCLYGIKVKCKRSLSKSQISFLENTFGPNVFGKYLVRNVSTKRKYIPSNTYTISKRYIRKFKSKQETKLIYCHDYERIVKIDQSLCW